MTLNSTGYDQRNYTKIVFVYLCLKPKIYAQISNKLRVTNTNNMIYRHFFQPLKKVYSREKFKREKIRRGGSLRRQLEQLRFYLHHVGIFKCLLTPVGKQSFQAIITLARYISRYSNILNKMFIVPLLLLTFEWLLLLMQQQLQNNSMRHQLR